MTDSQERLRAYLRLHLADGVGTVILGRLLEAFGSAEAAAKAPPSQLRRVEGVGEKTAAAIAGVTEKDIDDELAVAAKCAATVLCREDDAYPAILKPLTDRPAVLYVRGQLAATDALAVSIVGSRHCTHYGMEQAERFGQILGRAGFTIVSGGARGIDSAAHRGALAAGGRTVAVMGCGLCQTYPPENAKLFDQIASGGQGALVSELPMRTTVLAGNFPSRNRIISGMSLAVLVVEAARRSGSLISARLAGEQGRCVMAVPGRIDSPTSQGANELIRNGAVLVQDLDDILAELGDVGKKMMPDGPVEAAVPATSANLDATEKSLLTLLAQGPMGLDDLCRRSGLDGGKAISTMTMLVLKGQVAQRPGNVFEAKRR